MLSDITPFSYRFWLFGLLLGSLHRVPVCYLSLCLCCYFCLELLISYEYLSLWKTVWSTCADQRTTWGKSVLSSTTRVWRVRHMLSDLAVRIVTNQDISLALLPTLWIVQEPSVQCGPFCQFLPLLLPMPKSCPENNCQHLVVLFTFSRKSLDIKVFDSFLSWFFAKGERWESHFNLLHVQFQFSHHRFWKVDNL